MSPLHKLTRKKAIAIDDLAGMDFIAFERDIPTRKATDEILNKAGVQVSIAMEFDNVETVKACYRNQCRNCHTAGKYSDYRIRRKQLVTYKLEGGMHNRPLAIIHKKNRILTPALRSFVELMKNKPLE